MDGAFATVLGFGAVVIVILFALMTEMFLLKDSAKRYPKLMFVMRVVLVIVALCCIGLIISAVIKMLSITPTVFLWYK